MFTSKEKTKVIQYPRLSDLREAVRSTWEPALKHLGLVRVGEDSAGYKHSSVEDEIDDLMHHVKSMAYYNSSASDKENRQRFLADYALTHFSEDSINRLKLHSDSFVKRAIRNIALVYKWGATRTHEEKDDKYQALLSSSTINRASKTWNRIYTLSDYAAVMPVVKSNGRKQYCDFNIIGADKSRIKLDEQGNMIAFAYHRPLYDEEGSQTKNVIAIWTKDSYYWIDATGETGTFGEDNSNPYGEIPVVLFTSDKANPFESGGRSGLVDACLYANYLKLLATEDSVFAALGVWFGINVAEKGRDTIIAPNVPVFVDAMVPTMPTPDLKYVKGDPHSELLDKLKWNEEKRAMLNEGMSPAMLLEDAQELSGTALRNLSRETMEQREDDVDVMADCERELYHIMAIVCNQDMSAGISEDEAKFHISIDDPVFIDDMAAEYELDKTKLDDGVLGIEEFMRKYDTDITDEADAIQRITQRKAALARINTRRGIVSTAVQTALNPQNQTPDGTDGQTAAR